MVVEAVGEEISMVVSVAEAVEGAGDTLDMIGETIGILGIIITIKGTGIIANISATHANNTGT